MLRDRPELVTLALGKHGDWSIQLLSNPQEVNSPARIHVGAMCVFPKDFTMYVNLIHAYANVLVHPCWSVKYFITKCAPQVGAPHSTVSGVQ